MYAKGNKPKVKSGEKVKNTFSSANQFNLNDLHQKVKRTTCFAPKVSIIFSRTLLVNIFSFFSPEGVKYNRIYKIQR